MADDREATLMATLSLHLSDEDMIALSEEADAQESRLAYLEERYKQVQASAGAGDMETDLLAKYQLSVWEYTVDQEDRRTREVRKASMGWLISHLRNGQTWYGDRTHAFHVAPGRLTPFTTKSDATQSALLYAVTIDTAAKQFHHAAKQILVKLPVCPSIPKPDKGIMVQVQLDTDMAHALAMLREGCLSSNQLIRGRKPVDSNADVVRKILTEVLMAAAPTRNRIV